jgi:hypothetical protein
MEFQKFWMAAHKTAEKYKASLEDDGAREYIEELFKEYMKTYTKVPYKKWIDEILKNSFISANAPPKWIGEPFWPFDECMPMIFFHQFQIPLTARHINFPLGDSIYVFGTKKIQPDNSFSVAYRLIIKGDDGFRNIPKNSDIIYF